MPHKEDPLSGAEIDLIRQWIARGAPMPADSAIASSNADAGSGKLIVTAKDRDFWSFRPLERPELPALNDASRAANEIDRFILARLEAKELSPRPELEKRALLRHLRRGCGRSEGSLDDLLLSLWAEHPDPDQQSRNDQWGVSFDRQCPTWEIAPVSAAAVDRQFRTR